MNDKQLNLSSGDLEQILTEYHDQNYVEGVSDQSAQNFARYIRAQRQRVNLSQQELAMKVGVSYTAMYALEKGRILSKDISSELLNNLSSALSIDYNRLVLILGRPNEQKSWLQKWTEKLIAVFTQIKLPRAFTLLLVGLAVLLIPASTSIFATPIKYNESTNLRPTGDIKTVSTFSNPIPASLFSIMSYSIQLYTYYDYRETENKTMSYYKSLKYTKHFMWLMSVLIMSLLLVFFLVRAISLARDLQRNTQTSIQFFIAYIQNIYKCLQPSTSGVACMTVLVLLFVSYTGLMDACLLDVSKNVTLAKQSQQSAMNSVYGKDSIEYQEYSLFPDFDELIYRRTHYINDYTYTQDDHSWITGDFEQINFFGPVNNTDGTTSRIFGSTSHFIGLVTHDDAPLSDWEDFDYDANDIYTVYEEDWCPQCQDEYFVYISFTKIIQLNDDGSVWMTRFATESIYPLEDEIPPFPTQESDNEALYTDSRLFKMDRT